MRVFLPRQHFQASGGQAFHHGAGRATAFQKRGAPSRVQRPTRTIQDSRFKNEEKKKKLRELTPADIREAVLKIRSRKFPNLAECGTAGSFFKNPIISQVQFAELKRRYPDLVGYQLPTTNHQLPMVKIPLAWILDHICGLKGFQKGRVALFERQPIVLVNAVGASAQEIESFAKEVAAAVKEKTGIVIEWEVQRIK